MTRRLIVPCAALIALAVVSLGAVPAVAADTFTDVADSNSFHGDIGWFSDSGITRGCNPPTNTRYCPKDNVTRGQMAAFFVRALGLTDRVNAFQFTDTAGSVFKGDIERLSSAGITRGCNPPANDRFCPTDNVTRGQMAAFFVRALGLTATAGGTDFTDTAGSVFSDDILKLSAAGITRGCNPPANDRFCPGAPVTREQMAAFFNRADGGVNLLPLASTSLREHIPTASDGGLG